MRVLCLILLLVGCGDDAPASEPQPQPPPPATTTFTIHEWGFIGHHYASGSTEPLMLATGRASEVRQELNERPPTRVHGDEGRPIVYVHFDEPALEMEIELTLDIGEGRMVEHLPTALRAGSQYRWNVTARRGSCSAVERYPEGGRLTCHGRTDGYCEASHLAAYETDDAECLIVDGEEWNHLFYRTQVSAVLPLAVRREGEQFLVRANAALAGKLIRIRRGPRLRDTRVQVFDPPAVGAELVLPDTMDQLALSAQRQLETELSALGMTPPEAHAFIRAWGLDLWGSEGELRVGVQDIVMPSNLAPKDDSLVYFMPEAAVQAMAPLSSDPVAREIRRAIMVRIDLGEEPAPPVDPVSVPPHELVARTDWMTTRTVGSRDADAIRRPRPSSEHEFDGCYAEARELDADAKGLAEIRFTVDAAGSTSAVDVQWRAGGTEALGDCAAALVTEWSFEPSPGPPTQVFWSQLFDFR